MRSNTIIEITNNQFPFGQVQSESTCHRRVLVKKRIYYKTEKQHETTEQKINILMNTYHKNLIGFREVQDNQQSFVDLFYNYVPFSLLTHPLNTESLKQIHKQLIQLVIYLAKNSILTSFNLNRCGLLINSDNKLQVKYYLPLNQIVISDNIAILERSVQLFTMQSLHFLKELIQNSETTANIWDRSMEKSQRKFKQHSKSAAKRKHSQYPPSKSRPFSNLSTSQLNSQKRKLSNISRKKSQYSTESFKNTNSTIHQTFIFSNYQNDQTKISETTFLKAIQRDSQQLLMQKINQSKCRSKIALQRFKDSLRILSNYKEIINSLNKIKIKI